jgi:hypothetical protein
VQKKHAKNASAKSDRSQIAAFRKAARELVCDESEERFQQALRTVAKHKPKQEQSKPKSK